MVVWGFAFWVDSGLIWFCVILPGVVEFCGFGFGFGCKWIVVFWCLFVFCGLSVVVVSCGTDKLGVCFV